MRLILTKTLFVFVFLLINAVAQEPVRDDTKKEKKGKNRLDFVAAPLVASDPNFGTAFGGVAMVMFDMDPNNLDLLASSVSLGGMYSDRDSYAYWLAGQFFPNPDWRFSLAGGGGRIKNELDISLYPGTTKFTSDIYGVQGKAEYLVTDSTFIGLQFQAVRSEYSPDNAAGAQYMRDMGIENTTSGSLGPTFSYDTRDNRFFPHKGIFSEAVVMFNSPTLGSDQEYYVAEASINGFKQYQPNHVLAGRLYGRNTPSDTPYGDLSKLGTRSDLRGYIMGENVANNLVALQAEYRWSFAKSWVLVGFLGEAALFDNGDLSSDSFYASGGFGMRYCLHKERRVHFRVDVAWGEGDQSGFYVSISEAF